MVDPSHKVIRRDPSHQLDLRPSHEAPRAPRCHFCRKGKPWPSLKGTWQQQASPIHACQLEASPIAVTEALPLNSVCHTISLSRHVTDWLCEGFRITVKGSAPQ